MVLKLPLVGNFCQILLISLRMVTHTIWIAIKVFITLTLTKARYINLSLVSLPPNSLVIFKRTSLWTLKLAYLIVSSNIVQNVGHKTLSHYYLFLFCTIWSLANSWTLSIYFLPRAPLLSLFLPYDTLLLLFFNILASIVRSNRLSPLYTFW